MRKFSYFAVLSTVYFISLTSCGLMPQALSEVEHIVDDTAICQKLSQEAIGKNTNIKCTVELDNGQIQK